MICVHMCVLEHIYGILPSLSILRIFALFYVYECMSVYLHFVCAPRVYSACRDQKRASDILELKLQAIINSHVSADH